MSALSQISRIRQRISQLVRQRKAAERRLSGRSKLLKGTLLDVWRTCGKQGCKCAKGEKHICYQLSASIEGRTRTRNVPRKHLTKVRLLTDNYRRFRQTRAEWVRINEQIMDLINQLETDRTVEDFSDEPRRRKN